MTTPRILIGTPTYDGTVRKEYMRAVMELGGLFNQRGIGWGLFLEQTTMLHVLRSVMAERALHEGYTHLLFIDADIGFTVSAVERMLAADKAIIGTACPYRTMPLHEEVTGAPRPLRRVVSEMVPYSVRFPAGVSQVRLEAGICEVEVVGTGLFLVRCDVLTAMIDAGVVVERRTEFPFNQWLAKETWHDFFGYRVVDGAYLSEDFSFCRTWRELGGSVHALVDEEIMHIGPLPVVGRFSDRMTFSRPS